MGPEVRHLPPVADLAGFPAVGRVTQESTDPAFPPDRLSGSSLPLSLE